MIESKYQLVVRGQGGKYSSEDCCVYDLEAQTREEAAEEAKVHLYGHRDQWKVEPVKNKHRRDEKIIRGPRGIVRWTTVKDGLSVQLDPNGAISGNNGSFYVEAEGVAAAWLVETHGHFDIEGLRQEIVDFRESKRDGVEKDLAEYEARFAELKKEYGMDSGE